MELASMQENDEGQRAADLENDLQQLRERIEKKGGDAQLAVQKLLPLLQSLNALEKQESVLHSDYAESEAAISRLEHKLTAGCESQYPFDDLDYSLAEATEELNSAKKQLAARLRAVVSVKWQLDDVPTESEIIQYVVSSPCLVFSISLSSLNCLV
uniref:Paramyosin-related family protein n=1 Tax=Rhizophora mucronata TaxID=61149 RepID=A0A2P2KPY0_RHIMU